MASATVEAFWRWAYGDLCDDDVKAAYAEWLVALLLGLPQQRRNTGTRSDLITPGGVRLEVKSSAYWQSWKYVGEDGALQLPEVTNLSSPPATRVHFRGLRALHSDLYVFCMQTQLDLQKWDALDLAQWEFYLLERRQLEGIGVGANRRSITLGTLRRMQSPLSAAQFQQAGMAVVHDLERVLPTRSGK
ncbi:MAG TPA: hypothetical protein VFS60_12950 [Thermoanaerobaculia bacterium]|nr:hypothetical protein [Thermoanaerobaculia bacterium]